MRIEIKISRHSLLTLTRFACFWLFCFCQATVLDQERACTGRVMHLFIAHHWPISWPVTVSMRLWHVFISAITIISTSLTKHWKLGPFLNLIDKRCLDNRSNLTNLSVDKAMLPYFGWNSSKQRIQNKPIRVGYKVWVLAEKSGYVIQFDPYQGGKYCGSYTAKIKRRTIPAMICSASVEKSRRLSLKSFLVILPELLIAPTQYLETCVMKFATTKWVTFRNHAQPPKGVHCVKKHA